MTTLKHAALVTGSAGLLGQAICKALHHNDWHVVGTSRKENEAGTLTLDLALDDHIDTALDAFFERHHDATHVALIANASNRGALKPDWPQVDRTTFNALFNVDVVGHFLLARGFRARALAANKTQISVLFLGSIYGVGGVDESIYPTGMAATPTQYATAKAAIVGMTKDLAARWGRDGIRVNCLVSGGIEAGQPEDFQNAYNRRTTLGRMARVEEIATWVPMLCHPNGTYMTGQAICVDGGWTAW